jgi:putative hydrolase of the HAD superfamily
MAIQAVIFDVGGVLVHEVDSPAHRDWEVRLGVPRGALFRAVFASPVAERSMVGQATREEIWQDFARRYAVSAQDLEELRSVFWQITVWDAELLDFARSLRPRLKTGVISDAWVGTREATWDYVNDDVFDVIVFSAEEGICKPHPDIYRRALARLGVRPEEAVFVDDRMPNVEGARRVGMAAFQYTHSVAVRREIARITDGTVP